MVKQYKITTKTKTKTGSVWNIWKRTRINLSHTDNQRLAIHALLALLLSSATTFSTSATEWEYSVLHSTLLQIASTPALVAQVLKTFIITCLSTQVLKSSIFPLLNFRSSANLGLHIYYMNMYKIRSSFHFFKKSLSILQYFRVLLEYYFSVLRSIQNKKMPVLNTPEILRSIT